MLANSYNVNGKTYVYKQRRDDEDFIEAMFINKDDETDVLVNRFGDDVADAKRELESALFDMGISEDKENQYVTWESLDKFYQHKIEVYGRKIKNQLLGEWMTDSDRKEKWKMFMTAYCRDVYPHKWTDFEYERSGI